MLVNCVAYRDGVKLAEVPVGEIGRYLKEPNCFLWVGLKEPTREELEQMRAEFDLHPLAVEDAMNGHQRPKIEEYGNSLFAVLHTLEFNTSGEIEVGEVDVFVGKNYVLSIRSRSTQGFTAVRARCEREPELLSSGPVFVLYALMDSVVDHYFPVVDQLEQKLEHIEDRIFSRRSSARAIIEEVYALKKQIMLFQHTVAFLTESVAKLYGGRVPGLCQGMGEYFRDVADHVSRISKSIDSIREMSATAIQVNLSMISLTESEVTKKLASYGALFALPTLIAGVYGMNFKFMPELEWSFGYPSVLVFMLLMDLGLWFQFRKAKWL